jgi:hypothetical protein
MFCMAPCLSCGRVFTFNPDRVPSLDLKDGRGKQPICLDCMTRGNAKRKELGLPEHPILPGAYDPAPEFDDGGDFEP